MKQWVVFGDFPFVAFQPAFPPVRPVGCLQHLDPIEVEAERWTYPKSHLNGFVRFLDRIIPLDMKCRRRSEAFGSDYLPAHAKKRQCSKYQGGELPPLHSKNRHTEESYKEQSK